MFYAKPSLIPKCNKMYNIVNLQLNLKKLEEKLSKVINSETGFFCVIPFSTARYTERNCCSRGVVEGCECFLWLGDVMSLRGEAQPLLSLGLSSLVKWSGRWTNTHCKHSLGERVTW